MEQLSASIFSGLDQTTIIEIFAKLMIIFMITPIHECAHAWAAVKQGDDTPKYQGRLTLNPFAHTDLVGAVCLLVCGFGWGKPVQVNPLRFRNYRKGLAITAAAGPLSNLIVGLFGMTVTKFIYYYMLSINIGSLTVYYCWVFFSYFTSINLGLAVFNLIPIPPLDGSKIVSYFAGRKFDNFMFKNSTVVTVVLFVALATHTLSKPLGYVSDFIYDIMDNITFFVDIIAKAIFS